MQPALSTADAFHPAGVDQIGRCGAGKTVEPLVQSWLITKVKTDPELLKAIDQPEAGFPVGLMSPSWRLRPDQGVGEATGVQNGSASTGPAHKRQTTGVG